jgi:DNA-binding NtrC family response regulator
LAAFIESRLSSAEGRLYAEVIGAVERILLARVLRQTHGHQVRASEMLGVSRATLRHRLRTLGMTMGRALIEDDGPGTVKPEPFGHGDPGDAGE